MVPGAYWPEKLTVSRGIGLDPPFLKKLGPPPMMSRESEPWNPWKPGNPGNPWASDWPAPANNVTAANSKTNARVIFVLAQNQFRCRQAIIGVFSQATSP
jgi:hypothetical protein